MSAQTRASKRFAKHTYDSAVYGFIFDAVLPAGATISTVDSTTISTAYGTSVTALTLTGAGSNGSTFLDDDGATVAIGRAVQGTCAGGTDGCIYEIDVRVTTSTGEKYGGVFEVSVND